MKSFAVRFVLWLLFDVCLAFITCGLFVGLILGSGPGKNHISYGWLVVCGLLTFIMLARIFCLGRTFFSKHDVALGWRILPHLLHLAVLTSGMYVTYLVAMLLLGAGVSVGEPG